jgi:hypothetical protein
LRRSRLADKRLVALSAEILPERVLSPADIEQIGTARQYLYAYLDRHRGIGIYRGWPSSPPPRPLPIWPPPWTSSAATSSSA